MPVNGKGTTGRRITTKKNLQEWMLFTFLWLPGFLDYFGQPFKFRPVLHHWKVPPTACRDLSCPFCSWSCCLFHDTTCTSKHDVTWCRMMSYDKRLQPVRLHNYMKRGPPEGIYVVKCMCLPSVMVFIKVPVNLSKTWIFFDFAKEGTTVSQLPSKSSCHWVSLRENFQEAPPYFMGKSV